ncbi:hypothetical protein QP028_14910 [Corynebacterium suedekumii]|nr:hypothetical protein QP028_14910 [Corynebacterium suedekumii]
MTSPHASSPPSACPPTSSPGSSSDSVIGHVTAEAADRTGLPEGTLVIAGAGDVMQSTLATGMTDTGQATDSAGTTSILTVGVDGIIPEVTDMPGMLFSLGTLPGQAIYWGYIRAGGLSLRWFRDHVARLDGDDSIYATLDALAEQVAPGSDGVLFCRTWPAATRTARMLSGTWLGMDPGTDTARLWRSALEAASPSSTPPPWGSSNAAASTSPKSWSPVVGREYGVESDQGGRHRRAVAATSPRRRPTLANAALVNQALGLTSDMAAQLADWTSGGETVTTDEDAHEIYRRAAEIRTRLLAGPMQEVFASVRQLRHL